MLDNIISYSNLGPGTRFSLRATVRHTVFALKCFRRHTLLEICSKLFRNIAQMLPKVRKSAQGCSKSKIVLQTQKSAQKVLSAIGHSGVLLFRQREEGGGGGGRTGVGIVGLRKQKAKVRNNEAPRTSQNASQHWSRKQSICMISRSNEIKSSKEVLGICK